VTDINKREEEDYFSGKSIGIGDGLRIWGGPSNVFFLGLTKRHIFSHRRSAAGKGSSICHLFF